MRNAGIILCYQDIDDKWLDILEKMNIKNIGIHTLYQCGGVSGLLEWLEEEKTKKLLKDAEIRGFNYTFPIHAVDYLLPRRLFNEHPDYFRVNKDNTRTNDWNFCVSNKEALKYVEESSYELAKKLNQKSNHYEIWADDSLNSYCHCDKCKKYSPADQNLIISSTILKGLKRFNKEAKNSYLAYQDSLDVPNLKVDKDLFLEFAPIDRNHLVSISSNDDRNNKNNKNILDKLCKVFNKEVYILEYYLDVSYFCKWNRANAKGLELDEHVLEEDFKFYDKYNVSKLYTFAGFIDNEWINKYGTLDLMKYSNSLHKYFIKDINN